MVTDWLWGLVGGLMIGSAAAVYLLFNGRIMGASGVIGGLIDGTDRAIWAERLAFLAGLIVLPLLMAQAGVTADTNLTGNFAVIVAAGLLVGLFTGALFGAGLLLSGMTDTKKVQGWLDVFGAWDPTLAFVLGGAILPMAVAWRVAARRAAPVTGGSFPPPPAREVGPNLVLGSVLFGAGWALAGLCPGPAIASLSFGGWGGVVFLLAMTAAMLAASRIRTWIDAATGKPDPNPLPRN